MSKLPPVVETRLRELPRGLRDHVERAREVGQELALRHNVDANLVDLGIAAHDLARALKGDLLLDEATRHGLTLHPVEHYNPMLLHGPVAASWLDDDGGVTDPQVIESVRWHTTGRVGMSQIEKTVFLADKLDPQKIGRYPYLDKVRELSRESMDQALLEFVNQGLEYYLRNDYLIHPGTLELRNELMVTLGEQRH